MATPLSMLPPGEPTTFGRATKFHAVVLGWGWFVMLDPLPAGEHVVRWYATPPDGPGKGVTLHVTIE